MGARPRVGDRVRLTGVMDDPDPIPVGSEGTVDWVNTWTDVLTRQFSVDWDGSSRKLMLLDCDPYRIVGRR